MLKDNSLTKFQVLSGSMLKLIAIITMLIDHTALIFANDFHELFLTPMLTIGSQSITLYYIMRKIGRFAFPIFCFLISEGFSHTRNPKRYIFNLLLFALISEIPFNLMMWHGPFYLKKQNIFFTLFLGVILLYIYKNAKNSLLKISLMLLIGAISIFIRADYGLKGTLLILFMYVLKESPIARTMLSYPLLSGGFTTLAVFIPINMYNGKRGFIKSNFLKYVFYLFYPLHILILILIWYVLR